MEIKPERIGVVLIHGIGDQRRGEHVENVARHFVDISSLRYGAEHVSVTAEPGYRSRCPLTLHVSTAPKTEPNIQFDFHEVWWRDLGDDKKIGRVLKFWAWALSISGTRGQFTEPTAGFDIPENESALKKRVGLRNRLRLFLTTTFFFVMLFPLWLITNIVSIVPGLQKIRLFDSVFSYMSSVKLYQDFGDRLSGTIVDFDQPRRFSIQRRAIEKILHVHRQDYDRWYLVGHSLGSVIAFKALFAGDHAFARLMSKNLWDFDAPDYLKVKRAAPPPFPDEPKCPNWLNPDDAIDTEAVFARCRGFITWGSPLETFAHTWPATITRSSSISLNTDFEWINIYDAADVVASSLISFNKLQVGNRAPLSPINVSTKSHSFIAFSHTHYFHTKTASDAFNKVGFTILDWMIDDAKDFDRVSRDVGLQRTLPHEESKRRISILAQSAIAFFLGLLLWPRAVALMLNIVRKFPEVVIGFIDQEWAKSYAEATGFLAQQMDDPRLSLNLTLDFQIILHTAAFLAVCAMLHYLLIRPNSVTNGAHHQDIQRAKSPDRPAEHET